MAGSNNTKFDTSNLFKIEETEDHGKAMVATKRLEPGPFGLCVLREEAVLMIPPRGNANDLSGKVPFILEQGPQMWTDWWFFKQQPREVQKRIMDTFYCEMDCAPTEAVRSYLLQKKEYQQQERIDDVAYDGRILESIEEFVQFSMVIRFNSVELCPPSEDGSGPGTDFGHGLFENACKMSHSCKPNCIWLSTQDGKAKEIRAVATIEEGQELTIDYVGQNLEPIPQRRQELLMTKGFLCECDRCAANGGDDTRRFRCIKAESMSCPGVHFLEQPTIDSVPELLSCTHCGVKPSQSYTKEAVERERELVAEIKAIDEVACDGHIEDMTERIEKLEPPHVLHCLAEKCYELQGELYTRIEDYELAAQAYAKQLNCRIGILGDDYNSQATAFCCERLGDALKHVNVEEAEEAYKRTVRQLTLLRGGLKDPYSRCALRKLLTVQKQRARSTEETLPRRENLEGIAEPPGGSPEAKFPCVVCGNPSPNGDLKSSEFNYCCEEHRRMHLSLVTQSGSSSHLSTSLTNASSHSVSSLVCAS